MEIRNGSNTYLTGDMVADAGGYRLYLCAQEETRRQCLLQIATTVKSNGGLDRAAYILKELKRRADELELEYAGIKTDPNDLLNYDLGFPQLLDGFICHQQGGRRINILAFKNVEDVGRMVPLANITQRDRLRIDLRTSAWIMGKLLKLFVFTHSEGIAINLVNDKNILIEPDRHYVLLFDWSLAQTFSSAVPVEIRRAEIIQAAKSVVAVLGSDPTTGVIPDDGDEAYKEYSDFLLWLSGGGENNAERAHAKFYKLIDSLWKRGYHPFTVKPLTN